MQKARLLSDENSVSFQMFLILLSSIKLCSERQIPVFKEESEQLLRGLFLFCLFVPGERGGGGGVTCAEAKIWR